MYEVMLDCWEPTPQDRPTFGVLVQRVETVSAYINVHIYSDMCIVSFPDPIPNFCNVSGTVKLGEPQDKASVMYLHGANTR